MSNYWNYRDIKIMIANELMNLPDWKIYDYKEDESDAQTDYFSPANWGGIAEKNGYILCVNISAASDKKEIRKYNQNHEINNISIEEKISKLEQMTTERGTSEQEEESAIKMIKKLKEKTKSESADDKGYIVTGYIPEHLANPPRCNWHIEKNGVIIAKGNGILKYATVSDYFNFDNYKKVYDKFKKNPDIWEEDYIEKLSNESYYRHTKNKKEEIVKSAKSRREELEIKSKIIESFKELINKIDSYCGCLVGEGEEEQYKIEKVIKYKKENKVTNCENGNIAEGQCFILKSNFRYGKYRGMVYRIHKNESRFYAHKLNKKLTKELKGYADSSNYWSHIQEKEFKEWIEQGHISYCKIEEVSTPYEVEKIVKIKKGSSKATSKKRNNGSSTEEININDLTFDVSEDVDTRTNELIFLVKMKNRLCKGNYIKVNDHMKTLGGYYSRFKKGFIFKYDPTNSLKIP